MAILRKKLIEKGLLVDKPGQTELSVVKSILGLSDDEVKKLMEANDQNGLESL